MGLAFALLLCLGLSCREAGADLLSSLGLIALSALLLQGRYALMRPATLGAVLLALSLYLALRWWRRRDRTIWSLPLVAALWLPTHGTAVLCVGVLGALVAAALITRAPGRDTVRAAASLVCATLLFVALPTGRANLAALLGHASSEVATRWIAEWHGASFSAPRVWAPWLLIGVGLSVWLASPAQRRGGWKRIAAPGALALLGAALLLTGGRNVYEALLLEAPLAALGLQVLRETLRRRGAALLAGAAPLLVAGGIGTAHLYLEHSNVLATWHGFKVRPAAVPEACVRALEALPPGRVINDLGLGGYLIWRRVPGGVFVDGRTVVVYTDVHFSDFIVPAFTSPAGLEGAARRFGAIYGLAPSHSALGQIMMSSSRWIPLEHGPVCSLFARPAAARAAAAAGAVPINELRLVRDPRWMSAWYRQVLSTPRGHDNLRRALQRVARRAPDSRVLRGVRAYLKVHHPALLP